MGFAEVRSITSGFVSVKASYYADTPGTVLIDTWTPYAMKHTGTFDQSKEKDAYREIDVLFLDVVFLQYVSNDAMEGATVACFKRLSPK